MAKKEQSIEEIMEELEQLLCLMEEENTSLEDSFKHYTKGVKLLASCHKKIDGVEKKLLILEENS